MSKQWDRLWLNATLATCTQEDSVIEQGAIAIKGEHIAWVGAMAALPANYLELAEIIEDLKGLCVTPGLIDCHTHLIYGGNRAFEFEWRLTGVTYEEIAKNGGGIHSTVSQTRAASEEELLQAGLKRARTLLANGVTTLEIKSGYGLDFETECQLLKVAKRIGNILPMTIKTTFLGAHTIPKEYKSNPNTYVDFICNDMIPFITKEQLADAVDVFCETIAFNLEQTERIFKAAIDHGLAIKCHAEQLSASGAAMLAAKYHALSVDHLEYISEAGIAAIAAANTTAVLLPGAFYYLRETKLPPIEAMRRKGIAMAISTDCNPGTSPILSLLLIMNMACILYGFTAEQALLGVTLYAAKALGLDETHGSLSVDKIADLAIWDAAHPRELIYYLGNQPLVQLFKAGKAVLLPGNEIGN